MSSIAQILDNVSPSTTRERRPKTGPQPEWETHETFTGTHVEVRLSRRGNEFSMSIGAPAGADGRPRSHIRLRTTPPSAMSPSTVIGPVVEEVEELTAKAVKAVHAHFARLHEQRTLRSLQAGEDAARRTQRTQAGTMPPRTDKTARDKAKGKAKG